GQHVLLNAPILRHQVQQGYVHQTIQLYRPPRGEAVCESPEVRKPRQLENLAGWSRWVNLAQKSIGFLVRGTTGVAAGLALPDLKPYPALAHPAYPAGGNPHHEGVGENIAPDDGSRPDEAVLPQGDTAE